jgi:beta-lactamase regulating signal transducer with metallopeptidase domain/HEAT repeat protein
MTLVERVGWVLLHFVWQGAAIALALGVLLALTREAQARLRYIFSCSALVLMLGATLATAALTRTAGGSAVQSMATVAPESAPLTAVASGSPRADHTASIRVGVAPTPAVDGNRGSVIQAIVDRAIPWLVMAWLAGVLLLTFRLLGGWWSTRALRVAGISPVPEWCLAQLSTLSARMGITRPVGIVASVRVTVPIILGHLKPVILLPAVALSGLNAAQIEAIVAHELAHVRRHDYLLNLAQTIIETLLFYHPAVWWVSRQVRESREHCCDDLAVGVCRNRREYVSALLELEELRGSMPALALGATGGSLLARGRRLLAPSQARTTTAPRLAASVIALLGVAAAVAGASFDAASVPAWSGPEPLEPGSIAATPLQPPQGSEATPVTTAPDTAASLSARWTWAEGAARTAGRRTYWIGYGVTPVGTLPPFIYSDRSSTVMGDRISFHGDLFSSDAADLRFPGHALAVPPGSSGVKLLFELSASGREPRLMAIHTSTMSLPVDTKGLPVFWLGSADAAQSLDRVDRFYRATSSPELKHDLIGAAGVHDASPAVVAWLERRVASGDPEEIRGNAVEWIAWHPIAASIAVLDRTARTDRSSHVRQEAAEAMGDVALPEAAPVLIALARSLTDTDARREAVEALGSRPEAAATDALAAIARDDANLDIQREAVETLGDLEDNRGVNVLLELARTHPRVDVRREAIETLGEAMPEGTAVDRLKEFLADRDPQIQEEAVDAIASIEDASSLETLMQLARSHTSTGVRIEAVEALAGRGHGQGEGKPDADLTKIVELLTALATADREIDIQTEATEALAEIGGTAVVAELRKLAETHAEERVRVEAIESLGESGAPAAETAGFLKGLALSEKPEHVRSEALETLADLHDRAGIAALIDLAREHPSADARREALELLLESDHPDARALFERALKKQSP